MLLTKSKIYKKALFEGFESDIKYYRKNVIEDWRLLDSSQKNHIKMIDYLLKTKWWDINYGLAGSVIGYNMSIVEFFIAKGANEWNHVLNYCNIYHKGNKLHKYIWKKTKHVPDYWDHSDKYFYLAPVKSKFDFF